MRHGALALIGAGSLLLAGPAGASDYVSKVMTRDLNVPAALAWRRIGGFCALEKFLPLKCRYSAGTGAVGTVRTVAVGEHSGEEVMVGQTPLSYTYASRSSPLFYHATMAVEPAGPKRSQLVYTFVWDQESLTPDARAKDAEFREQFFGPGLDKAKSVAEGK